MPRRLSSAREEDEARIGGAECASRTGLSLRALRVYEQRGLVRPARSGSGWRRYSAADLSRLNTIKVLKGLGLSLSQIRDVLDERSPSPREVLEIQALAWRARRQAAEQALTLIDGALRHLEGNHALSLDTLCELVRMYALNPVVPDVSERLSREFAPQDARLWSTWWAEHPEELAESARFSEAQLALLAQLKILMDQGEKAGGPRAQILMRRWEGLFLSHRVRERTVRQLAWNFDVTFRWFELVHKNRIPQYAAEDPANDRGLYTPRFATFLGAAHGASAHGKALSAVLEAARNASTRPVRPNGTAARAIARQFAALCRTHALGDAETYARFARFIEQINHGRDALGPTAPWSFLLQALGVHADRRGPARPPRRTGKRPR